MVPGCMLLGCL